MDQSIEKNTPSTKTMTALSDQPLAASCTNNNCATTLTDHKTDIHANTKSSKTLTVSTFNSHKHRNNDNYKKEQTIAGAPSFLYVFCHLCRPTMPICLWHPKALTTFVQSESATSLLFVAMELK